MTVSFWQSDAKLVQPCRANIFSLLEFRKEERELTSLVRLIAPLDEVELALLKDLQFMKIPLGKVFNYESELESIYVLAKPKLEYTRVEVTPVNLEVSLGKNGLAVTNILKEKKFQTVLQHVKWAIEQKWLKIFRVCYELKYFNLILEAQIETVLRTLGVSYDSNNLVDELIKNLRGLDRYHVADMVQKISEEPTLYFDGVLARCKRLVTRLKGEIAERNPLIPRELKELRKSYQDFFYLKSFIDFLDNYESQVQLTLVARPDAAQNESRFRSYPIWHIKLISLVLGIEQDRFGREVFGRGNIYGGFLSGKITISFGGKTFTCQKESFYEHYNKEQSLKIAQVIERSMSREI